jgi:hypothetical protein
MDDLRKLMKYMDSQGSYEVELYDSYLGTILVPRGNPMDVFPKCGDKDQEYIEVYKNDMYVGRVGMDYNDTTYGTDYCIVSHSYNPEIVGLIEAAAI